MRDALLEELVVDGDLRHCDRRALHRGRGSVEGEGWLMARKR
jgi:hypothetical protein